jgi:hypothetical protein
MHRWGRVAAGLFVLAALVGGVGCSDGDDAADAVAPEAFEERVVERHAITADQAVCVREYVYDAFSPDEIASLYESSIRDLPSPRWAPYVLSVLSCSLHDELVGGAT